MPLPVLAGIPWLAGTIGGLFTAVFAWFANFLTKRFAVVAAVVAVIVGITTAFLVAINALAAGISVVVPTEVAIAAGLVIPSNASACMSAYFSALVLRWAYNWNVKVIQYKLF